ncbi:pre-mRNA-splicing factor CWC25-like [Leptopilina heterotoma]|uniref:pre-mRNA-splicing factor CWC25-like n=1 Tax=Leptopilina heterotoma TaxID=63436 RepID=UPI001CA9A751|nr:pre-mRNA-splicing factor CWC25-like [Leptopilina heterotoma]
MNSSSDEYQRAGKRRRQHSGDRFPKKREKSMEKVKRRSRSRKRRPSTSSRSSSSSTERGSREFSRRTKNSERLRRETPRRTLPASRSGERHPRGAPRKRSRYNDSNLDRNRYDSVSESSVSSHPDERSSSSPPRDETEKPAHETTQSGKNQPGTEEKIAKQASVEVDNADPLLSQLDSTEFEKKATGEPVNDSVSKLWSNIFKTGFKKDREKELLEKYPPAENCTLMATPKLNPEIKTALKKHPKTLKRESYQTSYQNQVSAALAAIGTGLTRILNAENRNEHKELFETLSDAGKIMAALHHNISMARRAIIQPCLNVVVSEVAETTEVDSLLFGETFSEKLRAAKEVEKRGEDVTKATNTLTVKKGTNTTRGRNDFKSGNLNWRGPPRRSHNRQQQGGPMMNRSYHQRAPRK